MDEHSYFSDVQYNRSIGKPRVILAMGLVIRMCTCGIERIIIGLQLITRKEMITDPSQRVIPVSLFFFLSFSRRYGFFCRCTYTEYALCILIPCPLSPLSEDQYDRDCDCELKSDITSNEWLGSIPRYERLGFEFGSIQ